MHIDVGAIVESIPKRSTVQTIGIMEESDAEKQEILNICKIND